MIINRFPREIWNKKSRQTSNFSQFPQISPALFWNSSRIISRWKLKWRSTRQSRDKISKNSRPGLNQKLCLSQDSRRGQTYNCYFFMTFHVKWWSVGGLRLCSNEHWPNDNSTTRLQWFSAPAPILASDATHNSTKKEASWLTIKPKPEDSSWRIHPAKLARLKATQSTSCPNFESQKVKQAGWFLKKRVPRDIISSGSIQITKVGSYNKLRLSILYDILKEWPFP